MFEKVASMETMGPGAELGTWLETADRSTLSGDQLVELMKARHRQISHLQAEFYADMKAVADAVAQVDPDLGYEYAADEIGVALTWTRRAAEASFELAWELDSHPQIAAALREGRIDLAKAKTIVFGLTGIDPETASPVAEQVLERAERQTTGQIRARLAKLVITVNPAAASDRYQAGLKNRKVVLDPNQDGTANLHLYNLAPDQAALAFDRLDQHARALATGEELRTLDQLRSDVALDLLVGCLQHLERGRKPIVDLRVDLTTLMGLNESPGEIPGFGPVIADLARQLAEQQKSEWRLTVIDHSDIVITGTTRRRPSRPQRRRIETRNPHCVFPGCRTPAIHADIDHRQRWADGGPTEDWNLNPLCDHNHGSKDRGGWHLEMVDRYTYKWTSPLGLKYLVEIEPP
ncbi:MAG: HNH endonuclease [Actinobacteria bacterium]|nr:HNH endonuclease [Actinomycetota bacterium]